MRMNIVNLANDLALQVGISILRISSTFLSNPFSESFPTPFKYLSVPSYHTTISFLHFPNFRFLNRILRYVRLPHFKMVQRQSKRSRRLPLRPRSRFPLRLHHSKSRSQIQGK